MCNNYKRQMHKHWPLAASSGWRPGLYPCRSCCLHSCYSCCQSCHGPPLSAETVQEKQRKKKSWLCINGRQRSNNLIRSHFETNLMGVTPVSTTTHASSASSAHVPSVHWTASAHGSSSVSHVAPHGAAPGGSTQARNGAATTVKVSTIGESSSEGWGRQKAARRTVEPPARPGSCRQTRVKVSLSINCAVKEHSFPTHQSHLLWSCLCSGSLHGCHLSAQVRHHGQTGFCHRVQHRAVHRAV